MCQRDAVMVIGSHNDGKTGILKKIDGKDGIVKYKGGAERDVVPLQVFGVVVVVVIVFVVVVHGQKCPDFYVSLFVALLGRCCEHPWTLFSSSVFSLLLAVRCDSRAV